MTSNRIIVGDCREELAKLEPDSVDCVVTSPPYLGMRVYDAGDKEIGREQTIQAYVDTLVAVFQQIRRVLKPTGVAWLNIGDGYAGGGRNHGGKNLGWKQATNPHSQRAGKELAGLNSGLKAKQLMLIPERTSIAMQEDGWWVRQRVIWNKTDGSFDSAKDRDTRVHEHIYTLTKRPNYWWDYEATRVPAAPSTLTRNAYAHESKKYQTTRHGQTMQSSAKKKMWKQTTANRKNVWNMATAGSKIKHYALFPEELPKRCIISSCPPGGVVLDPFGGAGTTAVAAVRLGRRYILIELNATYATMARERLKLIPDSLF